MNLYREVSLGGTIKEKIKQEAEELFDGEYANATVKTDMCYWRKFNALHKYFFEHFGNGENDNCVNMYMEITDIEKLLELLKKLLDKIKLVDGLVDNGWTTRTYDNDEVVRTEGGEKKACDLKDGDIVIETYKDGTEHKAWASDIMRSKDTLTVRLTDKVKGRVVENPEICEELFPTEGGFFFGDTDYNEWYVQDIENTIPMLQKVLDQHKVLIKKGYREGDIDYYYRAWY